MPRRASTPRRAPPTSTPARRRRGSPVLLQDKATFEEVQPAVKTRYGLRPRAAPPRTCAPTNPAAGSAGPTATAPTDGGGADRLLLRVRGAPPQSSASSCARRRGDLGRRLSAGARDRAAWTPRRDAHPPCRRSESRRGFLMELARMVVAPLVADPADDRVRRGRHTLRRRARRRRGAPMSKTVRGCRRHADRRTGGACSGGAAALDDADGGGLHRRRAGDGAAAACCCCMLISPIIMLIFRDWRKAGGAYLLMLAPTLLASPRRSSRAPPSSARSAPARHRMSSIVFGLRIRLFAWSSCRRCC